MIDPRTAGDESTCPSDDLFLDIFLKNHPNPGKSTLIEHLEACPVCRVKLDLLRDLDPVLQQQSRRLRPLARASRRELEKRFRPDGRTRQMGVLRALASAATASALLLTIIFLTGFPPREDAATERGRADKTLSLPAGQVSAAPRLFVWDPVPSADIYRFELIADNLRHIAVLDSANPWILIPAEIQKELRPGQTYIWTIEAFDNGGMKIGEFNKQFELK